MVLEAKPDIKGLKPKGKIKFTKDNLYNKRGYFDELDSLVDGDINKKTNYGCLLDNVSEGEKGFIFEIYEKSNIYAYGQSHSDGSGSTPKQVSLYKKNEKQEFILYKENIPTKQNEWYLLFEELDKGIYKLEAESNYVMFTEWYVERLESQKFLIKNKEGKLYYLDKNNDKLIEDEETSLTKDYFIKKGMNEIPKEFYQFDFVENIKNREIDKENKIYEFCINLTNTIKVDAIELL